MHKILVVDDEKNIRKMIKSTVYFMLPPQKNSNVITISGSAYDDWYVARK